MVTTILDLGFLKVSVSYLRRARSGLFYYHRRIPAQLLHHYEGKLFRRMSLKTKSSVEAARRVSRLASQDDAYWAALKTNMAEDGGLTTPENREGARALMRDLGLSEGAGHRTGHDAWERIGEVVDILDNYFNGRHPGHERSRGDNWYAANIKAPEAYYTPLETEMVRLVMGDPSKPRVLLSDALAHYLEHHKNGGSAKFVRANTNSIEHVTAAVGDLPLDDYIRDHANQVKERLLGLGLKTASVRRALKSISAVFNHGRIEFDLKKAANPFEGLKIPKEGEDAEVRHPFTIDELKVIGTACRAKDDDIRHLIAIQADTGARLGEIVGLRVEDVVLDHDVPHIIIRPHEKLGRSLKNSHSSRKVPLVGLALWGSRRAVEVATDQSGGWLFPRYSKDNHIKSTHASNTVVKWLRKTTVSTKSSHAFRHSMRDRLRNVNAPEEIVDAIGGWSEQASIGRSYGQGYLLEQLRKWLELVVFE